MAISFVGQASAATNTVTLPSHNVGDFIFIFAFRNTTTAPTLPSGYTNIFSQSANGCSFRLGYKIAVGGDTSGTWTNANIVDCSIYRGVSRIGGAGSNTNASAASTTIPGVGSPQLTDASSWFLACGGSLQTTSMSTPTGTTIRGTTISGTGCMGLVCDSNGGAASWGSHTSTNGTNAAGGGGSVELVAIGANINTFSDPFNRTSLNATNWTQFTAGSATMSYAATGATVTYPGTTTSSTDGDVASNSAFNLTGLRAYVAVLSVPTGSTSTDCNFTVRIDTSNLIQWQWEAGSIFAEYQIAGSQTDVGNVVYSSTTHKYLGISESGGTISFDTSPDGVTWTSQFTVADPITITALKIDIGTKCFGADTSNGPMKFNNYNTLGGFVGKDILPMNNTFGAAIMQAVNRASTY